MFPPRPAAKSTTAGGRQHRPKPTRNRPHFDQKRPQSAPRITPFRRRTGNDRCAGGRTRLRGTGALYLFRCAARSLRRVRSARRAPGSNPAENRHQKIHDAEIFTAPRVALLSSQTRRVERARVLEAGSPSQRLISVKLKVAPSGGSYYFFAGGGASFSSSGNFFLSFSSFGSAQRTTYGSSGLRLT